MADLRSAAYSVQPPEFTDGNDTTTALFPMEESENTDTLNDETFGSQSFDAEWEDSEISDRKVDEFEKWKKMQKETFKRNIPSDEAPPCNAPQDEERMAQAISKLNNIDVTSPTKVSEDPLPNAHSIEALWPSSPEHSRNIVPPDSPYLQDLFSPTHKIWGSPSQEDQKPVNVDGELQNTKLHLGKQEERELFSPVLEDKAIVSALPKRIPRAIRAEDLEKLAFGRQSLPYPQPFVNGVPKVRPPPGLSPSPNMGQIPVSPSPYGMYQMTGLQKINPAQAQAYYAAMIKQRMVFSRYCRTPPPSSVRPFPGPFLSDPAHLRPRVANMGMPRQHARFITPQPRNWNYNRGGRTYDNRRRPQYFTEPPQFKYRPQYYVESEDEEDEEDGALMTAKEKDWLIRIQLMQLTTDKPELDDYYFHTFERRRLAKERATRQTGVEQERQMSNKDLEMTLPHVNKGECYKPAKFEGSLGQVSVGSVLHPRQVVVVGDSGKPKGLVGSLQETKKKYKLLLTIEKGFDYILPIEDLERMAFQMPEDVRPQLCERRDKLLQRCYDLLGLKPSKDSNKRYDDDVLLQMLSVRKGRRLLSRMLGILKEAQRHEIVVAITRNLRTLTKREISQEDNLCDALVDAIRGSPSEKIVEYYKNIVGEQEGCVLQLFSSKFTLRIVIEMMKSISELAKNIDEESLPLQAVWPAFLSLTTRDFVTASPKVLAKNYQEVERLVGLLNYSVEPSKLPVIQEHFRLVENALHRSPQR